MAQQVPLESLALLVKRVIAVIAVALALLAFLGAQDPEVCYKENEKSFCNTFYLIKSR